MKKKKVIFIVEDDPAFNKLLTAYLKSKDKWDVYSYSSGEECLENLSLEPDIFLEDFDLPGMNGIKVMKSVKEKLPNTEFIFLSGQTNIKIALEALQLGAFDYIVKDTNAKENALNKIDQIIKINRLTEEKQINKKSRIIILTVLTLTWILLLIKFFL